MNSTLAGARGAWISIPPIRRRWLWAATVILSVAGIGAEALPPQAALAPRETAGDLGPLLSTPVRVQPASSRRPDPARWNLAFEPIETPADSGVDYVARGAGYSAYVGAGGALLALPVTPVAEPALADSNDPSALRTDRGARRTRATAVQWIRLRLEGGSLEPRPEPLGKLPSWVHRLRGLNPALWQTHVPTHSRVRYAGVYPGVDVVYHGDGRQLEYDFVLAPGVDPALPRLRFDGVLSSTVLPDGRLRLETAAGDVIQPRPVAYQEGKGKRDFVAATFRKDTEGTIGFEVGTYDEARPLVIDPVLSYATLIGGTSFDQCWDISVNAEGEAFVVGETETLALTDVRLLSTNAFLTNFQGGVEGVAGDAFVARLNADGTAFAWFTYLGGSDLDAAFTISLGTNDEPIVGGFTTSTNFPLTAGAYQNAVQGLTNRFTGRRPFDGFLARLRADGSGLVAATLFGADGDDQVLDVAVIPDGRIVAVGSTTSTNLPVTASVAQPGSGGDTDGFLAVFSSDATSLLSSSYLGGSAHDTAEGVAVDAALVAHVVGITSSTNFPVLVPWQATNAGFSDAFALGVRVGDGSLAYATYLGGSANDYGYRVAIGPAGGPWLTGETSSTNFPVMLSIQSTNAGFSDGFLTHLSTNGQALVSSTYFGGTSLDSLWDVAADVAGNVHFVGGTFSKTLPGLGSGSLLSTNAGTSDILVGRWNADGTLYSTFYGAAGEELAYGVAADAASNTYLTGRTQSPTFPVASTNMAQILFGGGSADGFLLKVTYEPALAAVLDEEGVEVSWPAPNSGFVLETAPDSGADGWSEVPGPFLREDGRYRARLPLAATNGLFRLRWVPGL